MAIAAANTIRFTYEVNGKKCSKDFEATQEAISRLTVISQTAQRAIHTDPTLQGSEARVNSAGALKFYKEGRCIRTIDTAGNSEKVKPIFALFNEKIRGELKETDDQQQAYESSEAHARVMSTPTAAAAARSSIVELPEPTRPIPLSAPPAVISPSAPPRPVENPPLRFSLTAAQQHLLEARKANLLTSQQLTLYKLNEAHLEKRRLESQRPYFSRWRPKLQLEELIAKKQTTINSLVAEYQRLQSLNDITHDPVLACRLDVEDKEVIVRDLYRKNIELRSKISNACTDKTPNAEERYIVPTTLKPVKPIGFDFKTVEMMAKTADKDLPQIQAYQRTLQAKIDELKSKNSALEKALEALKD